MQYPYFREQNRFSSRVTSCGIRLNFSRQRMTARDWKRLLQVAQRKAMLSQFEAMMRGAVVNASEKRQALHASLRSMHSKAPYFAQIKAERDRMLHFAQSVRSGRWKGCRGDKITDVINIGIGGSEMGPHAVYHALSRPDARVRLHFLSTVDGILLERILSQCTPKSTLVIVSSKSFTTRETQVNAAAVDQWFLDQGIVGPDRARHMVVVSANPQACHMMCLPETNQFYIWEWVGGRFSVWGSIGLPLAIALGQNVFMEFLQGGAEMDKHAKTAPLGQNLPAILAMLAYWNISQWKMMSHCVLPYDERLRGLVGWLQQLEMRSLGKPSVTERLTGQGVWGANGNEAQHSFYQWLREGTSCNSIDMIWSEMPGHRFAEHYRVLLANARAQSEALLVRAPNSPYFNVLSTLVLDAITPRRLGALMAMYEHKTTMLGSLLDVNPFDQPGVELGKRLSMDAEKGMTK